MAYKKGEEEKEKNNNLVTSRKLDKEKLRAMGKALTESTRARKEVHREMQKHLMTHKAETTQAQAEQDRIVVAMEKKTKASFLSPFFLI